VPSSIAWSTSLLVLEGDGEVREFIGGWSDWRAWRDARDAAASACRCARDFGGRRASSSMTAGNETRRRRRLSFNEQREFDALPARIEATRVAQGGTRRAGG
jgi:ATP-binding cassette subfamily F protein uup